MLTNMNIQRNSRVKTSVVVSTQMEATAASARENTLLTDMGCVRVNSLTLIISIPTANDQIG